MQIEYVVPCHFGLEAVLKREIRDLGYEISQVEDGRVSFYGDELALCRANLFLRSAERVLLKAGEFSAGTFEELFQGTKQIPWEQYIPENGKFWVAKAASVKSRLFSPSDIQSIMKKAMVERMKEHYHKNWFPEDGSEYPVRVFIKKDVVTVGIDTTGESLHKRGYRPQSGKAPISETLAAALILLTPWKRDRILVDPFCGSGTFVIEAAMMAADIAPGMNREFTAENWGNLIPKKHWYEASTEAQDRIRQDVTADIQGYDIDGGSHPYRPEKRGKRRGRPSDPLPAEGGQGFETSKAVRIYYYQSALWRTSGGKGDTPADLSGFWRELPRAERLVGLYDHKL